MNYNLDITPDPDPTATVRRQVMGGTLNWLAAAYPTLPLRNLQYDRVRTTFTGDDSTMPAWQAAAAVVAELVKVGGRIKSLGYGLRSDTPSIAGLVVTVGHAKFHEWDSFVALEADIGPGFALHHLIEGVGDGNVLATEFFDLLNAAADDLGRNDFDDAIDRIERGVIQ
jgi:hypothetical protein